MRGRRQTHSDYAAGEAGSRGFGIECSGSFAGLSAAAVCRAPADQTDARVAGVFSGATDPWGVGAEYGSKLSGGGYFLCDGDAACVVAGTGMGDAECAGAGVSCHDPA